MNKEERLVGGSDFFFIKIRGICVVFVFFFLGRIVFKLVVFF